MMNMNKRLMFIGLCTVVILGLLWFNYINLIEAFGAGPPYYGRTTNMDKWTNPIPILLAIDIVIALFLFMLFRFGLSKNHKSNS
jgi:hypothetical protein